MGMVVYQERDNFVKNYGVFVDWFDQQGTVSNRARETVTYW